MDLTDNLLNPIYLIHEIEIDQEKMRLYFDCQSFDNLLMSG